MTTAIHRLKASLIRTQRAVSREQTSKNARLLEQAGFVAQVGGGIYTMLPLGLRVLNQIEQVIREEMEALGAHEVHGCTLQQKSLWEQSKRWDAIDVLYKLSSRHGGEFGLTATAEELLTSVYAPRVRSYGDLPFGIFQIGAKFRDEHRARSGLLRGREFRMKDLYSFHLEQEELDTYYESVCRTYQRVFDRCGIGRAVVRTFSGGGTFSRFSDEFQLISESGEDTIFVTEDGSIAINEEVAQDQEALRLVFGEAVPTLIEKRSIEVGNTFKLGTRFSEPFGMTVQDKSGVVRPVLMCCYGLGSTRLLGSVVEALADDRGLVWPTELSPYGAHLIVGGRGSSVLEVEQALDVLQRAGISVLVDDRVDVRLGEKLIDADLIGIPVQIIVGGSRTSAGELEVVSRTKKEERCVTSLLSLVEAVKALGSHAPS